MKIFKLLPLCLLLALAGAATASPSDYCSKPLRIALLEFGFLYNSTTADGIDKQMLDAVAKRTGCSVELVLMPRARTWTELQGGTLDVATAAIATPERKGFGYMAPYLVTRNVVLIRKGAATKPSSLTDLENGNLRLAVVRGFKHEPVFEATIAKLASQGRVKEVADVVELFRFLERGMVDAVFSQPIVFRQYFSKSYIDRQLVLGDWAPQDQFIVGNLILSRQSFTPQQAQNWDRLIAKMLADGTIYKINSNFLPPREAKDILYTGPRSPD